MPRVATFTDGSWLAVLPRPRTGRFRVGTWVRVIEYTVTVHRVLPDHRTTTSRTELFRLITTITEISCDIQHCRDRSSPHAVKRSQARTPAKRRASQQTSTPVDHIDLIPAPTPHA